MALFDAYVMVDWSASAVPNTGADSIWIGECRREKGRLAARDPANPPTREEAVRALAATLRESVEAGRRTLVGFDFAFGYPAGFARRLSPDRPDWQGVWTYLAAHIADGADNANNRFQVAAEINRRLFKRPFPFWGRPRPGRREKAAPAGIAASRRAEYGRPDTLPERRNAERRAPGTHPVWKLSYPGAVGSQSLVGIPRLQGLRMHPGLRGHVLVWPFETGLRSLERPEPGALVLAEIWPSLFPVGQRAGEVRDSAQVRTLAERFAELDGRGKLADLFAGDPALLRDARTKSAIEREEGWILGVTGLQLRAPRPAQAPKARGARRRATSAHPALAYERDPDAIIERSFAIIRAEADLSRFPGAMERVALRLIHASGMTDIAGDLAWSEGAAEAGAAALASGGAIFADVAMVAHGIVAPHLPASNAVICTLHDPRTAGHARELATTRTAAAVDLWDERLAGALVAIGNAPTALFRLLERVREGATRPALVLGFPVGFVGALEAKEALIASGLPHIALRGRRGGSGMAAAAVNALARLASARPHSP